MVLPDIKHELPAEINENKETMKEPEKIQDPVQTPAPTKEPEKEEKNTPVAVVSYIVIITEFVFYADFCTERRIPPHSLKTEGFLLWYL